MIKVYLCSLPEYWGPDATHEEAAAWTERLATMIEREAARRGLQVEVVVTDWPRFNDIECEPEREAAESLRRWIERHWHEAIE